MAEQQDPWTLHPILEPSDNPNPHVWYAIAAEGGPGPRIGHSCASVGGSAYVFGGATPDGPLDELHAFDQARLVWTAQGQGSGSAPPPARYEHLVLSAPAKGQFCVFAGAHAAGNYNDLHTYNAASGSWEQPATTGTPPSARTNPKGAVVGSKVFIYGGGDQGSVPVTDAQVHVLDLDTWAWSQPTVNGTTAPPVRQGHTMAAVGTKIYLFGGMAGQTIFGDLWVFDTTTFEWTEHEVESEAGPSGEVPVARSGHAAAVIAGSMYVMGGLSLAGGQPAALDDFWQMNAATMKWTTPKLETAPINGRLGHSMCPIRMDGSVGASATTGAGVSADAEGGDGGGSAAPEKVSEAAVTPDGAHAADHAAAGEAGAAVSTGTSSGDVDEVPVLNDITPLFTDALPGEPSLPSGTTSAASAVQVETPNALFIFGGMDMQGAMFEDSLLFRP